MTARRKVTLVELSVFGKWAPLASGYMQAYALKDERLREAYTFEKIALPITTPEAELQKLLEDSAADVFGFSCYVWNSALVRRLTATLLERRPEVHIILGGPQVMHHAKSYLRPDREHMVLCNGEGERTFSRYLAALLDEQPDLSQVRGLSFYRLGELMTTPEEPRIEDLSEIPSPYLEGIFDNLEECRYYAIETNRGCPFKCNYCYWGGAIGARVNKFSEERLHREFEWLSRSRVFYLFIVDANWGMLKRDVELTQRLADYRSLHGGPASVYFCAAKNSPERVTEITKILHASGMLTTQTISLQTMSKTVLERVNRSNIKETTYTLVQKALNESGISSYVELIWPLPGETVDSFCDGIGRLCDLGANAFQIFPLLLMNNVELLDLREEYGLVTIRDLDPNSEAELVVQTKEVGPEAYAEGLRLIYAVSALYSLRGLRLLGSYLSTHNVMTHAQLLAAFVQFTKTVPDNAYVQFCERSIATLDCHKFENFGEMVYLNHHLERDAFDELLAQFVRTQPFWSDPAARAIFELDLLNRPYVHGDTAVRPKKYSFESVRILESAPDSYQVEVPAAHHESFEEALNLRWPPTTKVLRVSYARKGVVFQKERTLKEQYMYCYDIAQRTDEWQSTWTVFEAPRLVQVGSVHR